MADTIIDNVDAGYSELAAAWYANTSRPDKYGDNCRYASMSDSADAAMAQWLFSGLAAGEYKVYEWHPTNWNLDTAASLRVYGGASLLDTVTVNQTLNGGQWNLVGTYTFSGTPKVTVGSSVKGGNEAYLFADAIKFEPQGAAALPFRVLWPAMCGGLRE